MKLKCFSVFISLLTVMLFVMTEPAGIRAANDSRMPDIDESQAKSLTIEFHTSAQFHGVITYLDGAEFAIYKVADLSTKGGSADYTLSEEYSSLKKTKNNKDITFDGMGWDESTELSKKLEKLVGTPDGTAVTDSSGQCTFSELEQGMYLVKEISKSGTAGKYKKVDPYLISVPLADTDAETNQWVYDVHSIPKTEPSSDTPKENSEQSSQVSFEEESSNPESSVLDVSTPESSVNPPESSSVFTGDDSASAGLWIAGLWIVSLVSVCAVMAKSKRKEADENE